MINKKYVITSETGVHARPATSLVSLASKFKSDIKLTLKNHTVDFKSVIGVMSLGVFKGEEITITYDGVDEVDASNSLNNLINELDLGREL